MQKTICWPNLGCAFGRAVCRWRSRIHSEAGTSSSCSAMTQHYLTTSAAAAVWASGPSFLVSAMLLIYTYFLLPARALKVKRCCLYCVITLILWWCAFELRFHCSFSSLFCCHIVVMTHLTCALLQHLHWTALDCGLWRCCTSHEFAAYLTAFL